MRFRIRLPWQQGRAQQEEQFEATLLVFGDVSEDNLALALSQISERTGRELNHLNVRVGRVYEAQLDELMSGYSVRLFSHAHDEIESLTSPTRTARILSKLMYSYLGFKFEECDTYFLVFSPEAANALDKERPFRRYEFRIRGINSNPSVIEMLTRLTPSYEGGYSGAVIAHDNVAHFIWPPFEDYKVRLAILACSRA